MRLSLALALSVVLAVPILSAACDKGGDARPPPASATNSAATTSSAAPSSSTSSTSSTKTSDDGVPSPGPSMSATTAASASGAPSAAAATATIAGSVNGKAFNAAPTVVWIGMPDDPATMAIYLIDKPLACADLAKKGWIHTIAAGTQVYEMIITGSTVATYAPSTTKETPAGQVEVNFILAEAKKNETRAQTGSVKITAIAPKSSITGTFDTSFAAPGSKLAGSFTATYCPDAHEP